MSLATEAESKPWRNPHLPLVEIITHCYAVELPQYAAMLVYQASSLVLHKLKRCQVCLSICVLGEREPDDPSASWEAADPNVAKVLFWVKQTLTMHDVSWSVCYMKKEEIGRRCIGRNRLALASDADIVWFSDVDQVFHDGLLDGLVGLEWPKGASMIYPRWTMIHRDHHLGDKRWREIDLDDPKLVDIDPNDFFPKRYTRAIGPVQIVRGDFAREHGYLDGDERWQRPTDSPFKDFRDDVAYRGFCQQHGPVVGVDLPGLFRLRHTRTTYQEDKQ